MKSALVAVPEAGLRTYGRPTDCHFPAVLRASVRCNCRSQLPLRDSPGIEPGSLFNAPERGRTLEVLRIADCWEKRNFHSLIPRNFAWRAVSSGQRSAERIFGAIIAGKGDSQAEKDDWQRRRRGFAEPPVRDWTHRCDRPSGEGRRMQPSVADGRSCSQAGARMGGSVRSRERYSWRATSSRLSGRRRMIFEWIMAKADDSTKAIQRMSTTVAKP